MVFCVLLGTVMAVTFLSLARSRLFLFQLRGATGRRDSLLSVLARPSASLVSCAGRFFLSHSFREPPPPPITPGFPLSLLVVRVGSGEHSALFVVCVFAGGGGGD